MDFRISSCRIRKVGAGESAVEGAAIQTAWLGRFCANNMKKSVDYCDLKSAGIRKVLAWEQYDFQDWSFLIRKVESLGCGLLWLPTRHRLAWEFFGLVWRRFIIASFFISIIKFLYYNSFYLTQKSCLPTNQAAADIQLGRISINWTLYISIQIHAQSIECTSGVPERCLT